MESNFILMLKQCKILVTKNATVSSIADLEII